MMKRFAGILLGTTLLATLMATEANALTLTYSGESKRLAPFLQFRGDYDLPFNLNISGGIGGTWDLSSFVSPLPSDNTFQKNLAALKLAPSDLLNSSVVTLDALLDLDLNLGYGIEVAKVDLGIGQVRAVIIPYLGYRHMFTFSTAPTANDFARLASTTNVSDPKSLVAGLTNQSTQSQLQGINYGARVKVLLPLGFSANAGIGASTLLGGNFTQANSPSAPLDTKGTTLPRLGLGAEWNLPFFNLAGVYAGYEVFFLPQDLRRWQPDTAGKFALNGNTSAVHSFNVGLHILWFGI